MEQSPATYRTEDLDPLSYSELKKLAKKHGIKGNLKHDRLVDLLLKTPMDSDNDLDSFSTPAQNLINSSRKNKVEKFNEDLKTPLATPRRGTYSLGSPIVLKGEEDEENKMPSCIDKNSLDSEKPTKAEEDEAVKTPSSPAVDNSMSFLNVTLERGSERKLRPRKVSFVSPVVTPRARRNSSLKSRPKTPVASRPSLDRSAKLTPTPVKGRRGSLRKSVQVTPRPRKSLSEANPSKMDSLNGESLLEQIVEEEVKLPSHGTSTSKMDSLNGENPLEQILEEEAKLPSHGTPTKENTSISSKVPSTAESSKTAQNLDTKLLQSHANESGSMNTAASRQNVSTKKKQLATPSSRNISLNKENVSLKKKQLATPNFKKIHEKAFEKMESIDDYQKRKMDSAKKTQVDFKSRITKAKSKIPGYSGIPFIPSKRPNLSREVKIVKPVPEKKDTPRPEPKSVQKKKTRFDLKASLSRKLGYTPYTGPLKPLVDSNKLNSSSIACTHTVKEPINTVVNTKRTQNRAALKGVRTNKRFELQMKNRKL